MKSSHLLHRVDLTYQQGFTLVEVIFTLLLLGILGATGAFYYFDHQQKAEEKLAVAAVDEAQVRIHTRFTHTLTQGKPCLAAVKAVDTLAELADDPKTKRFGAFTLSAAKEPLTESGVPITVTINDSQRTYPNVGLLKVPSCQQLALVVDPEGGLEGDGGFNPKPGQIVDEGGSCNPDLFPCGISEKLFGIVNGDWFSKLIALIQKNDSIDSTNPAVFITIWAIEGEYRRRYGDDLKGRMWSLELTDEGQFRVIVSNLTEDEIKKMPEGTRIECEMYDPNSGVSYGTAETKKKEKYLGRPYWAMDTSTFEPL